MLPTDVCLRQLTVHADDRGFLAEFFRVEWQLGRVPVQWMVTKTSRGMLRGVHVHLRHEDFVVLLEGHALLALRDLRPGAPSEGLVSCIELTSEQPVAVVIPPGVAHGLYLRADALYVVGASEYWDPADELGCHWSDPALGIAWPAASPLVSPRDDALPSMKAVASRIPRWRPR